MMRAIVFGECMIERRPGRVDGFAGDAFNVAAHLKHASPALEVCFASATGDDEDSGRMRRAWSRFGVLGDLSPVIAGGRIGAYAMEVNAAGERRFVYDRDDSAARGWLAALTPRRERLCGAALVFLSGVGLAILPAQERLAAIDFVAGLGAGILAFDPNARPALWEDRGVMRTVLEAAMAKADILAPSLEDLGTLWGVAPADTLLERCRSLGPAEVVLTLGAEGCLLAADSGPATRVPGRPRGVADTAGAGDAFDGAYLAARLNGKSPAAAARAGLARAARVVALPGALPMELF